MVTLKNFGYEQSTPAYVKQGVKGNVTPRGAISGGRGSFLMAGESPKAYFTCEENGQLQRINVYPIIKDNSNRRVTEKYCKTIFDKVAKGEYETYNELYEAIASMCE